MTKISQGDKMITTTKILAINNKILARTGSLTELALSQELATGYQFCTKHQK